MPGNLITWNNSNKYSSSHLLLGSSSRGLLRRDSLDDTNSNVLLHAIYSQKAKRRLLNEHLNQQRLRRDDKDKSRVAVLDVPRLSLKPLARQTVMLLQQLVQLARNVRMWQSRTGM